MKKGTHRHFFFILISFLILFIYLSFLEGDQRPPERVA